MVNALEAPLLQELTEPDLDRRAVPQRIVSVGAGHETRHDVVQVEVLSDQVVDLRVGGGLDERRQVHHAPRVDLRTEDGLGLGLVALGHGDEAHVVAEAGDVHAPRGEPAGTGTTPVADPGGHGGVRCVADDGRAGDAEPGLDVAELAVAVRGLIEVHEVEVDRAPRQLGVGLCVQVQHRLVERAQPGDPHLRGAERVHPGDDPDDVRCDVCLADQLQDRVARREDRLPHDPAGDVVGPIQHLDDLLRLRRHLGQDLFAVHGLAPGEEPHLVLGEVGDDAATHQVAPFIGAPSGACP